MAGTFTFLHASVLFDIQPPSQPSFPIPLDPEPYEYRDSNTHFTECVPVPIRRHMHHISISTSAERDATGHASIHHNLCLDAEYLTEEFRGDYLMWCS